ncbi:hypothetical protein BCR35DRAFT_198117 [Leucosporidium creatinivorum]|uniref:Zn(2)-C6 fungal-type domain-containing protein n=1 Tax=Leucosporidium creatinivorum TaxID=106004 RepID=A0A1Y2DM81_9BASI|nr:hypothetical protein BCR35DRAFT_198117 [Leucosporidium creatinivorum]
MPPDRTLPNGERSTSVSFSGAAALKLPLSSHGAKHAPSLERGKACLVCRARKIKCDGVQPSCGACRKSALAKGEDPNMIICDFDEPEKRRRPVGGGKVAGLEAKIAALEQRIAELTMESEARNDTSADSFVPSGATYPVISEPCNPTPAPHNFNCPSATSFPSRPKPPASSLPHLSERYEMLPPTPRELGDIAHHNYFVQSHTVHRPPVPVPTPLNLPAPSPLLDLFYPSWPKTLPSPPLVFRLVEIFFAKSHLVAVMVNKPKMLASLQLPPTHVDFPVTCLLHGMIAIAASTVSDDIWATEERYWAWNESPSDWHGRQAKLGIEPSWVNDDNYLQIAQTAVICCFLSYSSARFGEVWLECAQATRLAVPLGLNHIRASNSKAELTWTTKHLKTSMLPPTNEDDQMFERSVTFWYAFVCDRFASASTGWASSLEEADVTSLLPAPPGFEYPSENLNSSPLSLHNPHFFTSHPPHLVQSLQLYLKAVVLMGRVVSWLQRSPSPIGVGINNGPPRHVPAAGSRDPRDSPEFQGLDNALVAFQLSIPREYHQAELHAASDTRVSLVHAIPHASVILLHEPFVTMQEDDPSMKKCSVAAREILKAIVTLYSSSFDIALLVPFINFAWAVAGRTLVRELAIKQAKGIVEGCDEVRSSVETILAAMRAYSTPLGSDLNLASPRSPPPPPFDLPPSRRSQAPSFRIRSRHRPRGYTGLPPRRPRGLRPHHPQRRFGDDSQADAY